MLHTLRRSLFPSLLPPTSSTPLPHSYHSTHPDSLLLLLHRCSAPRQAHQIHAQLITMGFQSHLHLNNQLIKMYSNIARMDLALKLFDRMPLRTVVSWNVLVSGFALNLDCEAAYGVFCRMESEGFVPNSVTWTSLLSAFSRCRRHDEVLAFFDAMRARELGSTAAEAVAVALSVCPYLKGGGLEKGRKIHGFVVGIGHEAYPFVRNSLLSMYGKLGCREEAEVLFSEAEVDNLVSWNALISSYASAGLCNEAYEVFSRLEKSGEVAPDVVSWSAVIGGFASAGMVKPALDIFRQMQQTGMHPNSVTIATVLSGCAELSAVNLGREIHGHTVRSLMDRNILVGNGLLNMYTKSGDLSNGVLLFDRMKVKDLISWNTMITGFGMHGFCDKALSTFDDMVRAGVEPDGVTFVAILSACSHAGRVIEGRQLFNRMVQEFNLSPVMEHYSCMVDLLSRAGLLREASELIEGMPMRPNACVLGALLNSCRIYGNTTVAEDCIAKVLGLEGENAGSCMLLSNIYAASGKWEESRRVRVMTKVRGLKKKPGQSWIEVRKKVYAFSAASSLPDGAEEVCRVLEDMSRHMEGEKFLNPSIVFCSIDVEKDGTVE